VHNDDDGDDRVHYDDDDGDYDDDNADDVQNFKFSLKLVSSGFGLVANGSVVYGFMLTFFIQLQY